MLSNRPRLATRLHLPIRRLLLGERTRDRFARSVVAMAVVASLIGPSIGSADTATTRLLVKFKTTVPAQARANALGAARATAVGSVRDLGVDVVAVPVARADEALNALERNPAVEFAEADEVLQPQDMMPNDPAGRSRHREPIASAASSMRTTPRRAAISLRRSQLGIAP